MDEVDSISVPYVAPSKPPTDYNEPVQDFTMGSTFPDFLTPLSTDPVRVWKLDHEKVMFNKLITTQQALRDKKESSKLFVMKMLRKIPILLMTREFLNKEKLTIDARAYVIDKLIPVVVLGLEALLIEADKRSLIEKEEPEPNFNPIDFLARYLMRNNPMYSNFNEASPYVRGIRQVCEELKTEIFHLSDNKLAKVKADAKNKRIERQKEEERRRLEAQRRIEVYQKLFDQFLKPNQTKIDYETVHISIKSFSEIIEKFPEEIKSKLTPFMRMKYTEEKLTKLSRKDFGLLISHYADKMSPDIFNQFSDHLSKCAKLYAQENEKEIRREKLSNLFMTCDLDQIGILDRQRILMLFNQFYEQSPENIKAMLRDPMNWPIYDYNQANKIATENEKLAKEESQETTTMHSNVNNSNQPKDEEPIGYTNQSNEIEEIVTKQEEILNDIPKKEEENEIEQEIKEENEEELKQKDNEDIKDKDELEEKEKEESDDRDYSIKLHGQTEIESPTEDTNQDDEIKQQIPQQQPEIKTSTDTEDDTLETETIEKDILPETIEETGSDTGIETKNDKSVNLENYDADDDDQVPKKESILTKPDGGNTGRKSEKRVKINEEVSIEKEIIIVATEENDEMKEEELQEDDDFQMDSELLDREMSDEVVNEQQNEETEDGEDDDNTADSKTFMRELTRTSTLTHSSAYDDENITFTQMFQVTEEFLGGISSGDVLDDLIEFIRENYEETPEERLRRTKKAHRQVVSAKRKVLIDELFMVWDHNSSGYVAVKEIESILKQYRNGMLEDGIKAAKKDARMRLTKQVKNVKLNRKEFRRFIYQIGETCDILDEEGEIENMVKYFINLIQKNFEEKMRTEARRKWLNNIAWSGEISHGTMEGIYKATFQALYKDVETHGEGKKISVSIALLENNTKEVEKRGRYLLHFVAATPDQSDYVVNTIMDRTSGGISFHCIYSGKLISIPHASSSPNIIFWNPDITPAAKEGSVSVVPIKDDLSRTFGVMIIDTCSDPHPDRAIISNHENFYFQGVAKQFSCAFQHSEMLRKIIRVHESALSWICRRINSIKSIELLLRERQEMRSTAPDGFVLRRVLRLNDKGDIEKLQKINRMGRDENLFKKYLFDAMETSQTINAGAYGERYSAVPLRDLDGTAIAILDINTGHSQFLPTPEANQLVHFLALLQQAVTEIIKSSQLVDVIMPESLTEATTTTKITTLSLEQSMMEKENSPLITTAVGYTHAEMLFDQLMLTDLRNNVAKLDAQSYAELKSYKDPPVTIRAILECLLSLLYPEQANNGVFKNWEKCKKFINLALGKLILAFDPFGDISEIPINSVMELVQKIPHAEIDKHSSKPAKDLFNWVFCVVNLIEHRMKMKSDSVH